ncbi:ubiquitin carboxyl-terminal hydrolase 36 isoform X1 [Drosophila grimshawi]|uniref:ubiquitin carboxyl-terminal hydrolase 36 isoform X1 n=1 Tax=Drosophila grimshawi TaxID=7222 RepID=UPI000C870B44|nr:ubiquitin carboxyl-terminal hydrolase 36 isoform X1 [Drosophila grimshawi]
MPVSLAVCETTANVVNAALRESLGSCVARAALSADEAKTSNGGGDGSSTSGSSTDNLQSQIVANAKRVLLAKIDYEEVDNYHESVLAKLKSKYIVIKPDSNGGAASNGNGNYNGSNKTNGKFGAGNGHDNNGNGNGIVNGGTSALNGGNNRKQIVVVDHQSSNQHGSPSNPNELPKPKRVLYQREHIRIGWKQSERKWQVGTGMLNVGNTCYLNSSLQALFHIPSLANWLVSESAHLENCNISESCGSNGCIICAMAKTLQSTQSNQSAVRPFLIYSKLRQICKHMVVGRQEDAHEFLRFLIEAMEKAYLMRFRNYKELDQLVKETTPLNQIFGGYLRSEVRCLSCNHVSITFQHFQDLLLDIRKSDTLEDAFDGYFSRERLEDMGYKCEGCKKKVSATKQFSLERAPITLCIQLKRFSMMGNKLTKQISFKPRIDLSRFAARSPTAAAQPLSYRLVSMVTHLGVSQHCGHYTAIGLTETGSYYNFDDSCVRPIAMQSVCNTNAYIMFYELDVNGNGHVVAPKMNGMRLTTNGGQQHSSPVVATAPAAVVSATATSTSASVSAAAVTSPRFIGPQLPNGYGNSNGHALGGGAAKTAIQFKTTPQKHQQQQQAQTQYQLNGHINGAAKFQTGAANANANKSSCNTLNNSKQHQPQQQQQQPQHILPISSDEEEDSDDDNDNDNVKTNKAPQLPSMPKMFEESSESVALTAKLKPKTALKSLVPYESASEEEEQQQQQQQQTLQQQAATNSRKRRSGADSSDTDDDDDEEQQQQQQQQPSLILRNGHAKTNGNLLNSSSSKTKSASNASSANVNSSKQKTDAIDEIFKSLNNYKNKHRNDHNHVDDDDDDDEDEDEDEDEAQAQAEKKTVTKSSSSSSSTSLTNGWQQSQNGKATASPKTPPSPAVIKTKTGIWQVTRNDEDDDENVDGVADADDDDDNDEVAEPAVVTAKNHKNPFAAGKATATTDANPSAKRQKLLNGSSKSQQTTPRIGNGYQGESLPNGNAVVSELLKQNHRGYGSSVLSWNGKASELDKELLAEAREQRKRDDDDEEENEMDRGRQRKIKSASVKCGSGATAAPPGYNPFQEYESQKRWHSNKSGSYSRFYHHPNYRSNFQQRNKFKHNRFAGGGGGAKFQQQRALQRHLASGGGFTRRQHHQSSGQQQQQS